MDPIWLLLFAVGGAAALLGVGGTAYGVALQRDLAPMRELARRWGRGVEPGVGSGGVAGRLAGRRVEVLARGRGFGGTVLLRVRVGCSSELALAPDQPGEIGQAIGVDDRFDRVVRGSGPPDELRASTVGRARDRVMDAVGAGCRLRHGVAWWSGPVQTPADELQRVASLLVALAEVLSSPEPLPELPAPPARDGRAIRAHALRQTALLAGKRTGELDPSDVRAMLRDPDPRVAVAAARSLADAAALWELAEDEEAVRRAAALVALAEIGAQAKRVERGLLRLVEEGAADEEVVRALGAVGSSDALGALRSLTRFGWDARARAASDAIHRIQGRSGASPGALDEAGLEGGALTEAETPSGGEVSLPPERS